MGQSRLDSISTSKHLGRLTALPSIHPERLPTFATDRICIPSLNISAISPHSCSEAEQLCGSLCDLKAIEFRRIIIKMDVITHNVN